jgi:hypothetical protein
VPVWPVGRLLDDMRGQFEYIGLYDYFWYGQSYLVTTV